MPDSIRGLGWKRFSATALTSFILVIVSFMIVNAGEGEAEKVFKTLSVIATGIGALLVLLLLLVIVSSLARRRRSLKKETPVVDKPTKPGRWQKFRATPFFWTLFKVSAFVVAVVIAISGFPLLRDAMNIPDVGPRNGDLKFSKWTLSSTPLSYNLNRTTRGTVKIWKKERRFELPFFLNMKLMGEDGVLVGQITSSDFAMGETFPVTWEMTWRDHMTGDGALECHYNKHHSVIACNGTICGEDSEGRRCRRVNFSG